MESHYSLNIARRSDRLAFDGKPQAIHFATVDLGRDREFALAKAREFVARFPEGDKPGDYKLDLTYWDCVGRAVEIDRTPLPPVRGANAALYAAHKGGAE